MLSSVSSKIFASVLSTVGLGTRSVSAQVLAQDVLAEVLGVVREQLLDDVGVDLLALDVPHLLVAAKVREGVVGLADLVFAREHRRRCEERHRRIVGMLGAHAARD